MANRKEIVQHMAEFLKLPSERLEGDVELGSIVNSSFILVELVIELQEEYGIRFEQSDMQQVTTVGQLVDLVQERAGP